MQQSLILSYKDAIFKASASSSNKKSFNFVNNLCFKPMNRTDTKNSSPDMRYSVNKEHAGLLSKKINGLRYKVNRQDMFAKKYDNKKITCDTHNTNYLIYICNFVLVKELSS